jgi:hypothetical protein
MTTSIGAGGAYLGVERHDEMIITIISAETDS